MNHYLATVVVAPMTTTIRPYPSRVGLRFKGKRGQAVLDQIRAADKSRLVKKLGQVPESAAIEVAGLPVEMFRWQ